MGMGIRLMCRSSLGKIKFIFQFTLLKETA
jgi:hypothetical protein